MSSQISARVRLYHKIYENLVDSDVKSLRAMLATDNKLGRARLEKANPQEICIMLEEAGVIGKGNLGLLIELLSALGQRRLAEEARKVEEEEQKALQSENERKKDNDVVDSLERLAVRSSEADNTSSRVTEQQLNKLAGNLGSEWENLTIHLGMKKADVDRFKAENPFNMRSQIFSMFVDWKAKTAKDATVEKLVSELRSFGIDQDKFEFLLNET
ncbi:PREDICTED: death domain-containing protein CRADD-like [Branchiostoma belcheri]|uniref:Death domain-containing protein CRADD-like n=1 Tax=Branchiostoma belcheri TaxID=7741 RepID=A0A6P4YY15_BRABE|nr:PREDICTED: death domain-containing protein CRADD-like [Branchiostoma belcheri]